MIADAEQEMAAYAEMPGAYGFGNIAARMTKIAETVDVAEAECILKAALEKSLGAQTQAKLDAMDADERRRRIRTLVEKIVVNDDGAYMVAAIPGASGALCLGGRDGPNALHVRVVEP
jgi:hypothetical protein